MGRLGVTFEDVSGAIAKLQGSQKNATVDNIRAILGTGSKSTIARFLREWKSQRGLASHDHARLPSELLAMVTGLWDAVQNRADAQADECRKESETKAAMAQQQLTESRRLEENLRHAIHVLEEKQHHQAQEIQQLKAKLIVEEQEKIRITERAAALDARRNENHAENQRLHQLLKHVQENLEHYQASTQRLREEQSLLTEKQRNEYEQKIAVMVAQANAATGEKAALQTELVSLKKSYDFLENEHRGMRTQCAEIRSQYDVLKITDDKMQQDYDARGKQNQLQATELAAAQRAVMELQLTLRARDEKIVSIEASLTSATDKIETLRQESQFTLQEKENLAGQLRQMQIMMSADRVMTGD